MNYIDILKAEELFNEFQQAINGEVNEVSTSLMKTMKEHGLDDDTSFYDVQIRESFEEFIADLFPNGWIEEATV